MGEPNGFEGIKSSIPMRKGDRTFQIDWAEWVHTCISLALKQEDLFSHSFCLVAEQAKIDRNAGQAKGLRSTPEIAAVLTEVGSAESGETDPPSKKQKVPELDTTIVGPWMRKWELVHHNRHTEALALESENRG
mmetsp:Transcript_23431/g.36664  ORF Transcript_23431/g.36664 Transcript_23431/m.36664 type:complete len:134 (+) Transcript_23431:1238-1639(+)